jgi:hypothetical protein
VHVAIELLIRTVVIPLLRRLGDRWLDRVADRIDAGELQLLRTLFTAISRPQPAVAEVDDAVAELAEYALSHQSAREELVVAATEGAAAVARNDQEFLELLLTFLMYVFGLVETLERPVVLPGFLTGTSHLVAIDVRSTNPPNRFVSPRVLVRDIPRIAFEEPRVGHMMDPPNWPRMWLIDDTIANGARLNELLTREPSVQEFVAGLRDDWVVIEITRGKVDLKKIAMMLNTGVIAMQPGERKQLPWDEGTQGVITMREALVSEVESEERRNREFYKKWSPSIATRDTNGR